MSSLIHSTQLDERREAKRFEIDCPVTVRIRGKRKGKRQELGQLCNVGVGGAKIFLGQPLPIGTRVVVHVHFPNPNQDMTTVRFEGTVMRLEHNPPYLVSVQFRRTGQFVRSSVDSVVSEQEIV